MTITTCQYETPVGPICVLAEESDDAFTVIAAGFCPAADLWDRLPTTVRKGQEAPLTVDKMGATHDAILAYLDGDVTALENVPVRQVGTELQQEVWSGLRQIPPGETKTYKELAGATSKPKAVRAVGSACGRNLIAPMVPCHRALRSDGSLGGYYYGLEVKQWLLAHEGASMSSTSVNAGQLSLPT